MTDPNIFLWLKLQILKADDSVITAADIVARKNY